jgi:hypothetical protein
MSTFPQLKAPSQIRRISLAGDIWLRGIYEMQTLTYATRDKNILSGTVSVTSILGNTPLTCRRKGKGSDLILPVRKKGEVIHVLYYVIKHCAMKAYGEWRYSSILLNFGSRDQLQAPTALPPRIGPPVHIGQKDG